MSEYHSGSPSCCRPCIIDVAFFGSALLPRSSLKRMGGWQIENTHESVEELGPSLTVYVGGKRTDKREPIYWVAPRAYLGQKVSSLNSTQRIAL